MSTIFTRKDILRSSIQIKRHKEMYENDSIEWTNAHWNSNMMCQHLMIVKLSVKTTWVQL